MTREEAITNLNLISVAYVDVATKEQRKIIDDTFDMAIKALEQELVLDKIRAEIEQNAYPIVHGVNSHEKGMTLYGILQIIDKYKSEGSAEV